MGPAEQLAGGSREISASSFCMRLAAPFRPDPRPPLLPFDRFEDDAFAAVAVVDEDIIVYIDFFFFENKRDKADEATK